MSNPKPRSGTDEPKKLSTFGGVFTPSLLTILGLVLFLRVGFVTGSVGLLQMLVILVLATAVSLLTTVSLAAIATNLRVGGGGVYFLISRTLGPAFGGAIGLVLYLAMSVSIAFYAIGLGEAVASVVGASNDGFPQMVAAGTIVLLIAVAWLGADIATRLQYVVMVCLAVALLAFFIGIVPDLGVDQLGQNLGAPPGGGSFWVSFAIFFPAITGFTQGVAMSGDLRTPGKSITSGTFLAIGLSTVVYLSTIVAFSMAVPLSELQADTAIMRRLSISPALVDVGVIAATLSSAIASILGAPRTLQRLAGDRLVKPLEMFAVGSGPNDNPRRAMLLSAAIALVTVAIGDLDLVAGWAIPSHFWDLSWWRNVDGLGTFSTAEGIDSWELSGVPAVSVNVVVWPDTATTTFFARTVPRLVSTPSMRPSAPRINACTAVCWCISTPIASAARA